MTGSTSSLDPRAIPSNYACSPGPTAMHGKLSSCRRWQRGDQAWSARIERRFLSTGFRRCPGLTLKERSLALRTGPDRGAVGWRPRSYPSSAAAVAGNGLTDGRKAWRPATVKVGMSARPGPFNGDGERVSAPEAARGRLVLIRGGRMFQRQWSPRGTRPGVGLGAVTHGGGQSRGGWSSLALGAAALSC